MATNTYVNATTPMDTLIGRAGDDVIRNATLQAFPNAAGQQVRFGGFGLTYNAAGVITGGIITSISVVTVDAFNNVLSTIEVTTGFAVLGVNFQNALNISPLEAIKLVMAGNDTVNGSAGNDLLQGHNGNDLLNGNGGDDRMVGGNGDDTYNGGAGIDTIDQSDSYGNPAAITGVLVNTFAGGNGAMLDFQGNVETFTSVEGFIGTQFVDTFIDFAANNNIYSGMGGNDVIIGGAGNDTVDHSHDAERGGAAGVTVNLATNTAIDGFGNTDTLNSIENAIGSAANDVLIGNAGINILRGLAGNDELTDGGAPAPGDQLLGGAGDDIYNVSDSDTDVDEAADSGAGTDEVRSSVSFNLRAGSGQVTGVVENLTLTGAAEINGFGNDIANIIKGNDAANQIAGFGGDDDLQGNGGSDVLFGGLGSDKMSGGEGDDQLFGDIGNDTLEGGVGSDNLNGGLGNDTYNLGDEADGVDAVVETGGNDTVTSTIDRSLQFFSTDDASNVENLTLLGTAVRGTGSGGNNTITGNDANNQLFGLAGNDVLIGGLGNDVLDGGQGEDNMQGGAGNDVYFVDNANDDITDTGGIDTAISRGSLNLNAFVGVEHGTLIGAADGTRLIGTNLANVLTGSVGDNFIFGLGGNDVINGGLGDDTLRGGAGVDRVTGGGGFDTFVLDTPGAANRDVFVDFNHAQDTIALSKRVFSALGNAVEAGEFRNGVRALDASDHLIYNRATGNLSYDANGSAAGGVTLIANLANHAAINHTDFVLI